MLLLVVAACAVIGTEERPAPGGVYREAVIGQPLSLNPLLHPHDPIVRDVSRLVYAGLVRVTEGGQIEGDLATGWTSSDDGRSYSFRLREGATWHDGQPVVADDVLTTLALLQSPTSGVPRETHEFWRGVRVEAPSRSTVRFTLAEPLAAFIEACSVPILPRHLFGSDGSTRLADHPSSYAPIGAGSFRVRRFDPEGIRLEAREDSFGRRPLLDEVHMRFHPDLAEALRALDRGDVDGLAGAGRSDIEAMGSAERFAVHRAPLHGHQTMLLINHARPALADPPVRRAIALAIQRDALISGLVPDAAVPIYGPISPASWAYDPLVETRPDLAAAGRILDEVGWTGGPVRTRAGRMLSLGLASSTQKPQIALAETIAGQLAAVGIRGEVEPTHIQDLYREKLMPGDFDLALVGVWRGSVDPDPFALWHSTQQGTGLNFGRYNRPRADETLAAARFDGDPTRRLANLTAFQQLWVDDVPAVALFQPLLAYVVTAQFRGVRLGTLFEPADRFQRLSEWHTRTQRVASFPR